MPTKSTDVVVFGTSPIMLIKALEIAQTGQSVSIFDRSATPGGGWYAPPAMDFDSVEVAVHLIENRPKVQRYLRDIGIELEGHTKPGYGLQRSRRISLAMARAIAFTGILGKSVLKGNWDEMRRTMPRARRSLVSIFKPFAYPRLGARGLVEVLIGKLAKHGVHPSMGVEINEIVLSSAEAGGLCKTTDGDVHFSKIHVSSRAHCQITLDGKTLNIPMQPTKITSLVLRLRSQDAKNFSYIEILADPTIRRVRDVTAFTRPNPPLDERLICVQLRDSDPMQDLSNDDLLMQVLETLERYRLILPGTVAKDTHIDRYSYQTIPDTDLERLRTYHTALSPVKSTDFAEDIVI